MAVLPIRVIPDPVLRKKTEEVSEIDQQIVTLLENLAETMYQAPGVGLAAPQVGELVRAFVVDIGDRDEGHEGRLYKFINPTITKRSGSLDYEEGCLSIPEIRETVKRAAKIRVEAIDELGKEFALEAEGLLAICIQHELDHLDGILFIDRLSQLKRDLLRSKLARLEEEGRKLLISRK